MNTNPKKRCSICKQWYKPDPRTKAHQHCCSRPDCRNKCKAYANKSWQMRHPGYDTSRGLKKRDWAQQYPNYWQEYRRTHPAYCEHDNKRRQASRRRVQTAANQDAIREISVGKLSGIPRCEPETAANQALMDRRVDTVVEYLLWKECAANQDGIGIPLSHVPY